MDLKDLVVAVGIKVKEADLALNAGHADVTERYLLEAAEEIVEYFEVTLTPAGDVTESAKKVSEVDKSKEQQEAVPGAQAQQEAVLPDNAAQQKAPDQAGP